MSQKYKPKPFYLNGFLIRDVRDIMNIPKLSHRQKRRIIDALLKYGILVESKTETFQPITFKESISGRSVEQILEDRKKRLLVEHRKLREQSKKFRSVERT